jgi:hypothetical protein
MKVKEFEKMEEDDWGIFQIMSDQALIDIALGKIDTSKVAKEMLAGRGVGKTPYQWVGFENAEKEWDLK